MQRDRLLLGEAIDAAERLVELTAERTPADFDTDRDRRDALLWNFTVLGEAVAQLSEAVKAAQTRYRRHCATARRQSVIFISIA